MRFRPKEQGDLFTPRIDGATSTLDPVKKMSKLRSISFLEAFLSPTKDIRNIYTYKDTLYKYIRRAQAGVVVQLIVFAYVHKILGFHPALYKTAVVARAFNSSTKEAEAGGSEVQGHSGSLRPAWDT